MKLVIQIPCFNESAILAATLSGLPRSIPGIDQVEWLVIDDGSSDDTKQVAENAGVDAVVRLESHQGLAAAYSEGMRASLRRGADIIVNFDADGQYRAEDIPRLIEPILKGRADMVIGDRQVATIEWFSPTKRRVHRFGCWLVSLAVGQRVPDPVSGFRALGRWAAAATALMNRHTHTLETLVQAGAFEIQIEYIPIKTNPPTRPSRLIRSVRQYVARQVATLARAFAVCRPSAACILLLLALLPAIGWLAHALLRAWLPHGAHYAEQLLLIPSGIVVLASLAILALYQKLSSKNEALRAQIYQQRVEAFASTVSPGVIPQDRKLAAAAAGLVASHHELR